MNRPRTLLSAGIVLAGIASIGISQQRQPGADGSQQQRGNRSQRNDGQGPGGGGQRGPGGGQRGGMPGGGGPGGRPGGPMNDNGGQREKVDCEVTVNSYNYSPRGEIDALIVSTHDDSTVQVSFPPPMADKVVKAAEIGAKIRVEAEKSGGSDDHELWQLRRIVSADGKTAAGEEQAEMAAVHTEGVVKSLNYNRQGDIDGVVLDNGDFIHLGPGVVDELNLKVDSKVVADGKGRAMKHGGKVIESEKINGEEVERDNGDRNGGGPPNGGPNGGGRDNMGPPPLN